MSQIMVNRFELFIEELIGIDLKHNESAHELPKKKYSGLEYREYFT
ncbi:hypothetical protein Bhyg_13440 [Pseudolycoriella hygida]|uniref:Uncharacterized protein n=1 Tax=Pseudolycoriella hygida TaxID=35572 RepID=A0A9Q0MQ33_9DIPT|nr:hypothetical protein Bhyg_13440 [Pseudolycoriella hygida]